MYVGYENTYALYFLKAHLVDTKNSILIRSMVQHPPFTEFT